MSDRFFVFLGGLFGFWGVAAAAAAAHITGTGPLATAASFLLVHAVLMVALPAVLNAWIAHRGLMRIGGWVLAAGVFLFTGDLTLRALVEHGLFPMAAPTGGVLVMLGWAAIGTSGLVSSRL